MSFLPGMGARVPPDANTLGCWKFDEIAAPFASSGSAGADNMAVIAGADYSPGARGLVLARALYVGSNPAGNNVTFSTATGAGTDTVLEPANGSLHGWMKCLGWNATGNEYHIITKSVAPIASGWNPPYQTWALQIKRGNNQGPVLSAYLNTAGGVGVIENDYVPVGVWSHVALTYDGTTMKTYLDGVLVGSLAAGIGGALDYGTHGPWFIGQNPANGVEGTLATYMSDWRVENVVRSAAYFRDLYRKGMGLLLP